jgi:hypothetical protein
MEANQTPTHKALFDICLCGASFPTAGRAAEHAKYAEIKVQARIAAAAAE